MKSHVSSSHLVHPLPFFPLSFLCLSFSVVLSLFFSFSLSLSLSPCLVVFFTVHERGWSTCNGKQRALCEEKRWPREREGEEKNDVAGGRARRPDESMRNGLRRLSERIGDELERKWKYAEIRWWTTRRFGWRLKTWLKSKIAIIQSY